MKVKNTGDTASRSLLWTKAIKCCFGLKKMRGQLCLYKVIEWEFHFLYLVHADNILLVSSDVNSTAGGKEVLVLKVQKNVLSRVTLVIIIEIHQEKNTRGIRSVA